MASATSLPVHMPEAPEPGPPPLLIDADIHTVKVHQSGATVYRRCVVDMADGLPSVVEIAGLPMALDDSTVRVRILSGAAVAGACHTTLFAKAPEHVAESPEEQAVQVAQHEVLRTAQKLHRLNTEIAQLRDIEMPGRPQTRKGGGPARPEQSPMLARLALAKFIDTQIRKRMTRKGELVEQLNQQEKAFADLVSQQEAISKARRVWASQVSKSVHINLSPTDDTSGPIELELSYRVIGARWRPQYQISLDADGTEARIALRAVVAQGSGEDWRGVRLQLSTAMPRAFTALPKLKSQRIGRAQPSPPSASGFRPPSRGTQALLRDLTRDRNTLAGPLDPPSTPQVEEKDFTVAPRSLAQGAHSLINGLSQVMLPEYKSLDDMEEAFGVSAAAGGIAVAGAVAPGPAAAGGYAILNEDDDLNSLACLDEMPMPSVMRQAAEMPPPPPSPAAKPARSRRRAALKKAEAEGGAADYRANPSAVGGRGGPRHPEQRPSFDMLHLPSPDSSNQAGLEPAPLTERYHDGLRRFGLQISFNLDIALQNAIERASLQQGLSYPTGTQDIRQSAGLFDYTYVADDPIDVPSDGRFHSIPLGTRTGECEVRYVVVPREDPQVFRLAQIVNPTRAPMLAGPAEIYIGDEYVLTTTLPTVAPQARFELGLGVEQAIACARNTHFKSQRSGERVVAMTELVHDIDIELVNRLRRDADIEIRERLPQPAKDAEVVVDELHVEPAWEAYTQKERKRPLEGGRRWRITLEAGGRRQLKARYAVKIYANNELVGGDRRER